MDFLFLSNKHPIMYLSHISLINFKNYDQLELDFSQKINCFVGDNGTGKTNLLDAIYYLSLTKSYFNSLDYQNIRHGEHRFLIQAEFEREGLDEKIFCGVERNKRKIFKRNKKEYARLSEHVGLLPVVMISPADSSLITEGSDERRKFMNAVISQYDAEYLEGMLRYNRALGQRNVLLKNFHRSVTFRPDQLEVWDEQLIRQGDFIYQQRVGFIRDLLPIFQQYYESVSEGRELVGLEYQSQLHERDLRTLLKDHAQKDRILQYTTAGIHKDDLEMSLSGYPIKRIGSQGQQKTFLVALKLAKFDFIRKVNGFQPILLLDDVFDKFDANRVKQIIRLVAEREFGQIFITDTNPVRIKNIMNELAIDYKLFHVSLKGVNEQT
jgi:DNA replication and repair protein RecF